MGKLIIPNSQILSIFTLESGKVLIYCDRTINRLIERSNNTEVE